MEQKKDVQTKEKSVWTERETESKKSSKETWIASFRSTFNEFGGVISLCDAFHTGQSTNYLFSFSLIRILNEYLKFLNKQIL